MAAARDRTLTARHLNRAMLARQHLLDRVRAPLPAVLDRMGGLQAQYAPAMYVGLWSRTVGFERATLDAALERRSVVQGTLLRSTIHLVSRVDYWPWAIAVRQARRDWYQRATRQRHADEAMAAAAARLREELLARGPLRRAEVDRLLAELPTHEGGGPSIREGLMLWTDLVRVPPSGTWARRRADLYDLAERWVGPEPDLPLDDAVELLVRRRLQGFGPATRREIADWAGLPVAVVAASLERLDVRRFVAEDGAELVDLPRLALPDPGTPAPVRFLAHYDAMLLGHARRAEVLPARWRGRVFRAPAPHPYPPVLVDGTAAATWQLVGGRVVVEPFDDLPAAVRRELDEEAERLTALHG